MPKDHVYDPTAEEERRTLELLIPGLFVIAKSAMRVRCAVRRGDAGGMVFEELSVLESAIRKMAFQIESLRI